MYKFYRNESISHTIKSFHLITDAYVKLED